MIHVLAAAVKNTRNVTARSFEMLFSLLSALLLVLSFPKFSFWPLAWFSFVPVFYAARREKSFGAAFLNFYLFGFIFFLASVEWLRHVSIFGWMFVVTAYALFFGIFGLAVYWFWSRGRFFLSLFVLPSLWCVLEWIRAEMFVWGFGWNLLAYSQAFNPTISGIGSLIGALGLSGLILFANLAIFFILDFEFDHRTSSGKIAFTGILSLALIFGVYFIYELKHIHPTSVDPSDKVTTAVIQGNIPQSQKWDPKYRLQIIETHEKLTALIAAQNKSEKPDLIIWPEAAYPGFFNIDSQRKRIFTLARLGQTPILFGGLYLERLPSGGERYFNSAYLIHPQNQEPERYDKLRLVSFGEYVPWRGFFNLFGLERFAYSLGVSDFEPGSKMKLFSLDEQRKFSALICFEDTFPYLSREAVAAGARFLVVITNDAWFGASAAPYQHLQASIFRAIENGVPVIRSANTGISAIITSQGTVLDRVRDSYGHDSFIAGGISGWVSLPKKATFYQTSGYLLPRLCLLFVVCGFILGLKGKTE